MDHKERARDLFFKGLACIDQREFGKAESFFRETLALSPRSVPTLNNLAMAQYEQGKTDEAALTAKRSIAIEPENRDALFLLSTCQKDQKQYDDVINTCQKIIAVDPTIAEAHCNLGYALKQTARYQEAIESFDRAIALNPQFADAFLNRGNALHSLKQYDDAFACYDKAISLKPAAAEAWLGRGNALNDLRRYDDATIAFNAAININADLADAYWGKSLVKLSNGNFTEGWDLYEWRSKIKENISQYPYLQSLNTSVRLDRSALKGMRVAVLSEQGVGDEIMFGSILPDLIGDAKAVYYEVDPRLRNLFAHAFPGVNFIPRGDRGFLQELEIDVVLQAGSLGYTYRQKKSLFPGAPYLSAEPDRVDRWKGVLADEAGSRRKIGISWRGGTLDTRRDERSVELPQLGPLVHNDGSYFVSLQYGKVGDELARFNDRGNTPIHGLISDFNDFDEFAALVTALDLVISVQNTTVHMCGALGKTCWGMIPWRPEWRYGDSGNNMIWYSSVTLYRQLQPGDWGGVINSINSDLAAFVRLK